jgi:acyl dehydratase
LNHTLKLSDLQSKLGQPKLGQHVALSEWITISQQRIQAFADATGSQQFIRVDPERAAAGPFAAPIAHGFLLLSLLAGELANAGGSVQLTVLNTTEIEG